ncbi:MAG TPA: preprotein translocase subunit SecE [Candidatus Saccharimonadales bacterium]|nr:preprotein translocase subunit SecE [Candidatus Saccharimonadales bacterium]
MADEPAKSTPKKRRVKNPETFRERALKANTGAAEKAKRPRLGTKLPQPVAKPARTAGKVLVPAYFRNSWQELKLVTWPSWKQSRQLTFAVIIFAIVFGALIALVDFGLDKLFKNILLR